MSRQAGGRKPKAERSAGDLLSVGFVGGRVFLNDTKGQPFVLLYIQVDVALDTHAGTLAGSRTFTKGTP